jgi:hypothetical protein
MMCLFRIPEPEFFHPGSNNKQEEGKIDFLVFLGAIEITKNKVINFEKVQKQI